MSVDLCNRTMAVWTEAEGLKLPNSLRGQGLLDTVRRRLLQYAVFYFDQSSLYCDLVRSYRFE